MMEDEDMEEMDIGDKRDSGTPSASSSMSSTTPTISPEPDNEKRSKVHNCKRSTTFVLCPNPPNIE